MITILYRGEGSLGTPKSDYIICARPLNNEYVKYIENHTLYISSNLYCGFFASFFLSTLQCQEYTKAPPRVVITGELNPGIQDFAREIILILKHIFKFIIIADAMYKFLFLSTH